MITVYTTSICPRCKLLKAWLTAQSKPFQEANLLALLEDAEVMTELHMKGITFKAAPVLFNGTDYFGPGEMFVGGQVDEKKMGEIV